jgi:hypothetical protein
MAQKGWPMKLTYPATPMTMAFQFTMRLADRAWEALKLNTEERAAVDACPARPAGFVFERWGQSFTRWRIFTLNGQPPERVEDRYPYEETIAGYPVEDSPVWLWRDTPVHVVLQDRTVICFAGRYSLMPDATVYNPERVLFELKLPLNTMHPGQRRLGCPELEQFFVKSEPPGEGAYRRIQGRDLYECKDEEKGFFWELLVRDFRPDLIAHVTGIHKSWKGEVHQITLRLDETGLEIPADPLAVECDDNGRTLPTQGETVSVVVDDELNVERIWLSGH